MIDLSRRRFFFSFAGLLGGVRLAPRTFLSPFERRLVLPEPVGIILRQHASGRVDILINAFMRMGGVDARRFIEGSYVVPGQLVWRVPDDTGVWGPLGRMVTGPAPFRRKATSPA
jgi:hypothetical protein